MEMDLVEMDLVEMDLENGDGRKRMTTLHNCFGLETTIEVGANP